MTLAVIISTARTPLTKSWRGALNMTHGAKMGGHVVKHAMERAHLEPQEVEDVIMGCALPEGATGWNIARQIAIRAGCPVTTAGLTVSRFCGSGLQSIATASQRVLAGEGEVVPRQQNQPGQRIEDLVRRIRRDLRIDRGNLVPDGHAYSEESPYKRFDFDKGPMSPRAVIGTENTIFWNTGDEHDELGHITEDVVLRNKMMEKRDAKLQLAGREIPDDEKINYFGPRDAETVIVSWGSTKGAILDALDRLWAAKQKIGFLQIRLISPFPTSAVAGVLEKAETRVDVEMNYSAQLAGIVREQTGIAMTHTIVKYNGRPMSSSELFDALTAVHLGKAEPRTVLTHGA